MSLGKHKRSFALFGGQKTPWDVADWTASDDRVRGGKSKSFLDCSADRAHFHGTLDIKTLGGAGFASQRTTGDDRTWDLSAYVGLQLNVAESDGCRYTFILKDTILPPNEDDRRERATISWEYDFELPPSQAEPADEADKTIFIPWSAWVPMYRGKMKHNAEPLDKTSIKRLSIMMRSFFGTQEGDFSLVIKSIVARDTGSDS